MNPINPNLKISLQPTTDEAGLESPAGTKPSWETVADAISGFDISNGFGEALSGFSGIYSLSDELAATGITQDDVDTTAEAFIAEGDGFVAHCCKAASKNSAAWNTNNVTAFVQAVLRESYMLQSDQLRDFAEKVRGHNAERKALRAEAKRVGAHLAQFPGSADETEITPFQSVGHEREALPSSSSEARPTPATPTGAPLPIFPEALTNSLEMYEEDKARTMQVSMDACTFNSPGEDGHGATSTDAIDDSADYAVDDFLRYYEQLPEAQRKLLAKEFRENGIRFELTATEIDDWAADDTETFSSGMKMGPVESVDDYIKRVKSKVAGSAKQWITSHEEDYQMGRARVFIFIPSAENVEVPKYSEQELAEIHPLASITSNEQHGLSAVGHAQSGDPASTTESDGSRTISTKAELQAYQEEVEDNLNTVGEDAQMANLDLQNALQKQQQTLQMMSNISKMLHDTAMSIIRKIGS